MASSLDAGFIGFVHKIFVCHQKEASSVRTADERFIFTKHLNGTMPNFRSGIDRDI
jgi:hypothetical protein